MKTKLLYLIITALLLTGNLMAQKTVSNSYVFTTGKTTYGGDLGLTYSTVIGPYQDDASSGLIALPFTCNFLGQSFTHFSVTSNGLMTLGNAPLTGSETSNAMAASNPGIKIAPYWDDLSTGTNGYVKHAFYSGTLYVNFRLTVPKNTAGAANVDIQVRLTAGGGISFYYGSTAAPWPSFQSIPANSGGYSIGIGNSSTDFASVTPSGVQAATCAFGTANDANTQSITGPFNVTFTPDITLPTIAAGTIPNTPGTGNRSFTRTIADAGKGIPTSGDYVPRVYYKKNAGGNYVSTPGVLTSGTSASGTWTFTVDHGLVGGVAQGDVIYYYVAAQDQAFNVASNPAGVIASDVNTITSPASSPSSYIIPMDFIGSLTVGTGGNYSSLTNPGGLFEQLSAGNIVGNVTVTIISDLTAETGTIPLTAWTEGAGGPFTVTISPSGARTVSGTAGTNGLIYLNGAKNLIIDGLNSGGNSLTIANTSASNTAINFVNGANNNIIRNATITANGGSVITFGTTSTIVNYNNVLKNNTITSGTSVPSYGISFNGSTTYDSYDNVVDNNKIVNFSISGILLSNGYINTTVSNNEIYNAIPSGTSLNGITLGTYYGAGIYNVFNNYIHDLNPASSASTGTINGIYYGQSSYNTPNDVLNIYNNVISLDATTSNTNITLNGMALSGGNGSYTPQVYVYHNSIYLGGSGIVAGTSTGLKIGGGNYYSKHTIKNNAIYNARSGGSGKHYAVGYYYSANLISNNNVIHVSGTNGVFGRYVATDYSDLAAWQGASAQDAQSFSGNPGFTSPTNLLPDATNPASNLLDGKGTPVALVTADILGNTRDAAAPDIGAYEFTGSPMSYSIAGNAGIAGVTLSYTDGSAKSVQSEADGAYSLTVSYSWSGTVTPSKTGYTFTPENRSFSNVVANQTGADFTPVPIVFTISGTTGKANTPLTYTDGVEKTINADDQGNYSLTVSYNWSGTVTPLWPGFTYTPLSMTYENVLADQPNQDYTVAPTVFTITGTAGVEGTILTYTDGAVKTEMAGPGGAYSITVSYNWSGTVTPALSGYTFQPSIRTYTNLLASMSAQDYTAGASSYLIMGNAGVGDVDLSYTVNEETMHVFSNASGDYVIEVPFQWSGTVTPSKTYYTFDPVDYTYFDVTANQTGMDYTPTCVNPTEGGIIETTILSGCEPFDPELITGTEVAGPVEYLWQSAVAPFETWTDINSNSKDYNPGAITQTTRFKRLVRAACMTSWTGAAETDFITLTVDPLPVLQMTINDIRVTADNDGTNDVGAFEVCNSTSTNLSLTEITDLNIFAGTVKVIREASSTDVNLPFENSIAPLADYAQPMNWMATLADPTQSGTLELRFRMFNDLNNNDALDGGECAGDWAVYTVTVNKTLTPLVSISTLSTTVCEGTAVTFTATPTYGGETPSYEWFVDGTSMQSGTENTFTYVPKNGEAVSVTMTSSSTGCLSTTTASTLDPLTMTVLPTAMLSVTINGSTVSNNYDGVDDTQALNVCNSKTKNLFYEYAEMKGVTPSTLVKVVAKYTFSNVIVALQDGVFALSAPIVGSTNVRLNNTALPGTLVMSYRVFLDVNNNNVLDATECPGDWVVFTLTIPAPLKSAGPISGPATVSRGATPTYSVSPVTNATSYIWTYSGTGVTFNPNPPTGTSVTLTFAPNATAGTLSVRPANDCGEGPISSLKLKLTKSGLIGLDPGTASQEVIPMKVYSIRNVEIRVEGTVGLGARATLYDILGRVMMTQELDEGNLNILPLNGLKTAVYVLSINDNGKIQTFKVPVN